MHPVILKTFGGLSTQYYLRQFIFGLIFPAMILAAMSHGNTPNAAVPLSMYALLIVNTLLYPYSRFVYERVVGFVMGSNIFIVNAVFMLIMKLFTMAICWCFAIFIAPVGLLFLYVHHSRA